MRDYDPDNINSRQGNRGRDPFIEESLLDIENFHNSEDLEDSEESEESADFDDFEEDHKDSHRNRSHSGSATDMKSYHSSLPKRVLLVSIIVTIGFIGMFMWSWMFDIMGFVSGTEGTSKTQVAEIITLPAQTPQQLPRQLSQSAEPLAVNVASSTPLVQEPSSRDSEGLSSRDTKEPSSIGTSSSGTSVTNNINNIDPFVDQRATAKPIPVVTENGGESGLAMNGATTSDAQSNNREEHLQEQEVARPCCHSKGNAEDNSNIVEPVNKKLIPQDTLSLNQTSGNQKSGQYTIQIIAMQDKSKIEAFIKKSSIKDKLLLRQTIREGKPWHVVVFGEFASKPLAEAALLTLPADIQKNKPWVRSMQGVQ